MNELEIQQARLNRILKKDFGKVAVILEGRDTAGKTGTIRTLTHYMPIDKFSIHLSTKPSQATMNNWFRFWTNKLEMANNKMVIFDRSWYSRGLVQAINGWCSEEQYAHFMENVQSWEEKKEDIRYIKFWLSISEETQKRLIEKRENSPLTNWKLSPNDRLALSYFDKMTIYKERVITSTKYWNVIDYNDKKKGQLELITTLNNILEKGLKND